MSGATLKRLGLRDTKPRDWHDCGTPGGQRHNQGVRVWWMLGLAALGLGLAVSLWLAAGVTRLRDDARASAARAAPTIARDLTGDWDPGAIERSASPRLLERLPPAERATTFATLRERYGRLTALGAVETDPPEVVQDGGARLLTVRVRVPATFERGRATLEMILVAAGADWRLASFFVDDDPEGTPAP